MEQGWQQATQPATQPATQQMGALRAAAEARQHAGGGPDWEQQLRQGQQQQQQQGVPQKEFAPVGFHSNPAAKAAGASQGLMGAGMGGGM